MNHKIRRFKIKKRKNHKLDTRVPGNVYKKVHDLAKKQEVNASDIVRWCLDKYLAKYLKKKGD